MSIVEDPLARPPAPGAAGPDRLNYALGVMLDADDFRAEQLYHRSRLARVLRYLSGRGTVAGLEVEHRPPIAPGGDPYLPQGREEELSVAPGIAIDLLGRLIEVREPQCIRLQRWFEAHAAELDAAFVAEAVDANVGEVVADLFLEFRVCPSGLTPAFASGPYDATDAVVPSRLRDEHVLHLVLRGANDIPLPSDDADAVDLVAVLQGLHQGADRGHARTLALLRAQALAAWREGTDAWGLDEPERPAHVPVGVGPTAVFLARVRLGVHRDAQAQLEYLGVRLVEDEGREVVPSAQLLRGWAAEVEAELATLSDSLAQLTARVEALEP